VVEWSEGVIAFMIAALLGDATVPLIVDARTCPPAYELVARLPAQYDPDSHLIRNVACAPSAMLVEPH
jgi:hypothetical protein